MIKEKEEKELKKQMITNLIKYFEQPVKHAPDYDEGAIRDAVTHYFGKRK